jgi:Holliday junction DNA helicase RuvA
LVVREDAFELYGFESIRERSFFRLLLTVSGIGPKSALAILNISDIETLARAIASKNAAYLTSVSGIGKRTAEKIVVELQEKVSSFGVAASDDLLAEEADVIEALKTLGYSPSESREALKHVPSGVVGSNERIKAALRILSKA